MPEPKIKLLSPEYEEAFYRFTAEYLPDSEPERMRSFAAEYPKAFLLLLYEGEVIGAVFGRDRSRQFSEDDSFELCGIAVRFDFQRRGFGSMLLCEFEKSAAGYCCPAVSLGSAEGYAERFYIKNGYLPTEYKVWENGVPRVKKVFSDLEDYLSYHRDGGDGFVVMRKVIGLR